MKFLQAGALAVAVSARSAQATNPIQKVLSLLSDLQAKIVKEGEQAQKEYQEYAEWCEDRSRNVAFEIKTGKGEVAELQAAIEGATADSSAMTAKIDELGSSLSTNDADLKAATGIRNQESSDFQAEEKDLEDTISTLERAVGILEREMRKGGASALQLQGAGNLAKALTVMVDASMLNTQDASKLSALVQAESKATEDEDSDSDDATIGAPAAASYKGHSNDIVGVLEDLLEKAQGQLEASRKKESNAHHNFAMLKQSLEDEVKNGEKDMAATKKNLAATQEAQAVATGDLDVTSKALAEDEKTHSTLHQDCMTKSQDFEAATKSRGEELKALAEAKSVIGENTGGAESVAYGSSSFLQLGSSGDSALQTSSGLRSGTDLANFEVVRLVRDLARKHHDTQLTQLAQRMAAAVRFSGTAGQGPFDKVKGLITDMIDRLLKDGETDASHKAYCDKEMSETATKKEDKTALIEKLSVKIDSMTAKSAQLKEEVAELHKALAELAASQAETSKIRVEEKSIFTRNKADSEQGLNAIKSALKTLREYYAAGDDKAHESADGAANGVIGLLEVVESDLSKGLAEMSVAENTAQSNYDRETQENKIERATKEQDVKYKVKESKSLDKTVSEANSDRQGAQAELDAILEYMTKLTPTCVAKPETYEERAGRRTAEIEGLKEALKVLEGESALIQRAKGHRRFRGVAQHF
jgi:hypothetical protein